MCFNLENLLCLQLDSIFLNRGDTLLSMEGVWKVWRRQKVMNNSPDLDSYGKPLPPPPTGFYWIRLEDGSWELKKHDDSILSEGVVILEAPAILEHVVMPADTLQGICLKYRVSAVTLRQCNNFSGNAFRSKKSLRIPLEPGMPVAYQVPTEEVIIQKFINLTNEGREEAKFYLEDHHFDLMEAVAALNGDTQWLIENQQRLAPPTAPPMPDATTTEADNRTVVRPAAVAYTEQEMAELSKDEQIRVPLLG